jgi:uncharacterized protein (DUF1800 family)
VSTTLSALDLHYVRRWSGGFTPALAAEVRAAGGGRRWFARQLEPQQVSDPMGTRIDGWFPSLQRTPAQLFDRQRADVQGVWEVMADLSRWTVARRIHSRRQVLEVMVDFWSNLLHVPLEGDDAQFWRVDYDRTIRRYALTSFEELLLHATVHPAMGLNLNNAQSTKQAPNENLGRELLELHTVGVGAGYGEADVKSSARLLTGYRVDVWWPSFRAFYDTSRHWTGPVQVLGFQHANAAADGQEAVAAYLRYLARHPATAQRIATRLCRRFVSDTPSASIVGAVARAYTAHGTAIKPTLLALVDHPDFARARGAKVRTVVEDYVATVRALGITLGAPRSKESFVNAMHWQYRDAGQAPYDWPAPDGFPESSEAWSSAGRMLTTFRLHRELSARWWPTRDATYRADAAWLPRLPATLQGVIDHVGLLALGQKPGARTSQAIATVLGIPLNRRMRRKDFHYWTLRSILASLLDSPAHLRR